MEMQEWLNWIVPIGTVLAALISARASKVSANAARRSNAAAFAALEENRIVAQNEWRLRLMDKRMKIWDTFNQLMAIYLRDGYIINEEIKMAHNEFQYAPFVFEPEIEIYLNELTDKAIRHSRLRAQLRDESVVNALNDDGHARERALKVSQKQLLEGWLSMQHEEGKKIFLKHMRLLG